MSSNDGNRTWPWHISGVLMGLAITFAFATGHPVGTATTYQRVTGGITNFFAPEYVANNAHYQAVTPIAEWQVFFVIGLIVAGLIGRFFVARKKGEAVPKMFAEHIGNSTKKRYWHAFLGGFFLLIGSRIAGGCTSGLFMSGGSQLSLAAFVFAAGMFITGILTAKLLYKGRNV